MFEDTDNINGVIEKLLEVHTDERGKLIETFRLDELPNNIQPVMSYISYTKYGFYRGPHEHKERTEIFVFPGPGDLRIILWDNRKDSKTYLNRKIIFAGENLPKLILISPGIVHVIENITQSKEALLINYPNTLFKGWNRQEEWTDEILHDSENNVYFKDFMSIKTNHQIKS